MQLKGFLAAITLACVGLLPIATAQDLDLQSAREWMVNQPHDFSNEVLFERRGQAIIRSSRYESRGAPFGDFDGDFDIDQHDYYAMQICLSFSGPGIVVPPACLVFDRDTDGDVDLLDAAEFQTVFTGTVIGVFVEAGELVPVIASPNGYYSGVPGAWGNNALNGLARHGGYSQDDFWYQWTLIAKPENAGSMIVSNPAAAATAYTVLRPLRSGDYVFQLKVTNLVTMEFGIDTALLSVVECFVDADCFDNNACTEDSCPDSSCVHAPINCDDGLACTDDSCVAGTCSNVSNCPAGQQCGADGFCSEGVACETDADCEDDGDFCNGTESCSDDGFCISSGDPCDTDAGETCNEDLNECTPAPVTTVDFTLGTDSLAGTGGENIFRGPLLFNAPTGTNVPSVQSGDSANGGDGDDSLNAQFNFAAATTVAPTLTNIEVLNITDFGTAATTLSGASVTGATDMNFVNSTNTNAFVVSNLANLVDVGVSNQAIGANLSFLTAASSGATDAATVTVNNFNATGGAGTITYTTGTTNGLETLNVVCNGASRFQDIAMNGTSLTTLNVSGSGNLEILSSLDANVVTISASAATGNVILTATGGGNVTFTGGAGNDKLILGSTYGTADTVNGGAGTDTLGVDSAAAVAASTAQANVTNMEALTITDGLAGSATSANFGSGVVTTNLLTGFNGGTLTVASGHTITGGARGVDNDAYGAGTVTVSGSAITDTITFQVNDLDQNALTFNGVETLNIVSNGDLDGSAADGGANTITTLTMTATAATETLNVSGATALTITGAVTADVINASTFTAALTMSATNVTGGSGNDTLYGTTGADTISGGAGNDTFQGLAGADIITTGTGNDVVSMVLADVGDIITDFAVGMDKFDWNTALSSTDSSVTTPLAPNAYQSGAAGTAILPGTTVFELTGTTVAFQTAANVVTAIGATATSADTNANILLIVYTTGGGAAIWNWINTDADVEAGELTLVATFSGVTADSFGAGNFQ